MQRFRDLVLLASFYSILILVSFFRVPPWITVPVGAAVTAAAMMRRRADHRRKIENIQQRLSNLRSEGLFIEERVRGTEDDVFYRMILTLLTDLERTLFKLVEKNIQLLSLKEIGRNIISSLDEQRLIDSVFEYLNRGVGYRESAFILLRRKRRMFQAIVTMERPGRVIRRVINFGYGELAGAVADSFRSGKPFLIKDVPMHPIMEAGGEPMFTGSTMTSYIVVPLMKSTEESRCYESDDCQLRKVSRELGEEPPAAYLSGEECLSCSLVSLLGGLIVTDGYRAGPLTNIDQVTLETVASLVSSNIENWYLYQELRQEELFRERVIEGMMNGIFVVDLEGKLTLANRSARELSQYKQREISGLGAGDLVIEAGGGDGGSTIDRVLRNKELHLYREAYLRRRDDIHIPIRFNASPMIGEDGDLQGALIEFIDLSDIKRMEEEIRYLDRLAVLGRFTSAVAHEIRNPLTGIAAGIQYLNRSRDLSDEQRENIVFILNEVDRLNRIITDLFKVAKPRGLLYQQTIVSDLIERGYRPLKETFENKGIDFRTTIDDNLPAIEVDPDQIVQVLLNLIKNAVEAVTGPGVVSVRARLYDGGDPDVVREKGREMVCIEVADSGPGIEPDDREKIFEPFFSKKKGGTGLGLFVTHSIVQHHHGRISVASEPGRGATFRVYLPIARQGTGGKIEAGHTARR